MTEAIHPTDLVIDPSAIREIIDLAEREAVLMTRQADEAATDLVRVRCRGVATGLRLVQTDLVRLLAEAEAEAQRMTPEETAAAAMSVIEQLRGAS